MTVVLAGSVAAMSSAAVQGAGATAAPASAKFCRGFSANGAYYPVRVLRGRVSCRRARRALRRAVTGRRRFAGWTCFYGHGQDTWAITCIRGRETRPRVVVRAYNPSGAGASQDDPAYLPSNCFDQKIAPETVIITCADAGFRLTELLWQAWGAPVATATGTAVVNDCEPSCAEGTYRRYPVEASVTRLRRCENGRRQYTRLRYSFPQESPFPPDAPGSRDPTAKFPCPRKPRPRPRVGRPRVRLSPGARRFTVRTNLRVRVCAARGIVWLHIRERKTLARYINGEHFRTLRRRQRRRCQTHRARWRLRDEMFGVGRYQVRVIAEDESFQRSRPRYYQHFTSD